MKIIKYGAHWCGPCRVVSDLLKNSNYPYEEVDIEKNEEIANVKNIRSIPVVEFYKDDNENPVYTHIGLLTKDKLENIIDEYCK